MESDAEDNPASDLASGPVGDSADDPVGELARRAAAGERGAWEALVARFAPALWAVARSCGLADTDAADVSATVWLRLVEHLPRLREPGRVGAWLLTTARNESLRLAAANHRVRPTEPAGLDVPAGLSAEALALRMEDLRVLLREIDGLPAPCGLLLRLYLYAPALPRDAVAAATRLPPDRLAHHRRRCLGRLRSRLSAAEIP